MDKRKRYIQLFFFTLFFTGLFFCCIQTPEAKRAVQNSASTHSVMTQREPLIHMPEAEQVKTGLREHMPEKTSSVLSKVRRGAGAAFLSGALFCMLITAFSGKPGRSLLSVLDMCMTIAHVYLCQIQVIHERDGKKRAAAA